MIEWKQSRSDDSRALLEKEFEVFLGTNENSIFYYDRKHHQEFEFVPYKSKVLFPL